MLEREKRASINASTVDQLRYRRDVRRPTQDIIEESVSGYISWTGPQMATWRITGYVADSEGEDEDIELNFKRRKTYHQSQTGSLNNEEQTTAEDKAAICNNDNLFLEPSTWTAPTSIDSPNTVESSLHQDHVNHTDRTNAGSTLTRKPLQIQHLVCNIDQGSTSTRDVSSSLQDALNGTQNDSDSPLSTPPDSPTVLPAHKSPLAENSLDTPLLAATTNGTIRHFRPRKAIQINPYLLDLAKHQKEWGERGLKPVHITRVSSPERREQESESQDFASRNDSQASENPLQDSMDLDEVHTVNDLETHDLDGELPDLDDLLRRDGTNPRRQTKPSKRIRRLTNHMSTQRDAFDLPLSDDEHRQSKKPKTKVPELKHDSIPSPPRSGSVSLNDQLPSLHSPASESPELLSPAASTGLRSRRWRRVIEDDSQSQVEVGGEVVSVPSSEASDHGSETETESEDVRLMQKRLRGVLPASCLTVEKAQQEIAKKRNEAAKAAARSAQGLGVAQRKRNKAAPRISLEATASRWYKDLVSEDEESQENLASRISLDNAIDGIFVSNLKEQPHPYEDAEAVETMDDAGIDHMLPARHRAQGVRSKQRAGLLSDIGTGDPPDRRHYHRGDSARGAVRSRKRAKRSASRGIVHVLDAPGLSPKNAKRPSWLRVAARQARRTKGTGISASKKFFQLDTPEETAAAYEGLGERAHAPKVRSRKAVAKALRSAAPRQDDGRDPGELCAPREMNGYHQAHPRPSLQSSTRDTASSHFRQDRTEGNAQQDGTMPTGLSRLMSLLPLKNRAGKGQLVHRPTEPRVAQIEELQQDYRGISRVTLRSPSTIALHTQRSTTASSQPAAAPKNPDELTRSEKPVLESNTTCKKFMPGPKRRKKQTPVFRPKWQQTLLAPLRLNTEKLYALIGQTGPDVRVVLEREFVTHQAEWFQGRKESIVCANEATQQHFQVFLEVLKSHLIAMSNATSETGDVRGLRSFLYRLVPNRGSIGAQGQVGDKTMDVLEFDILVARNVFDLHVCLLNLAPAYAPLPRVLETKVNFADAHDEICFIALSAWQAICNHHHTQHLIPEGLSGWLYLILTQLLSRWKSAESDARAEAERSTQRIEERVIRKVIEHNRTQASNLMTAALGGMVQGVEDAISSTEATSLLNVDRYSEFVAAVTKLLNIDNEVFTALFKVASSYSEQWLLQIPSNTTSLLSCLRQAITALTSHMSTLSSKARSTMVWALFSTARVAISHRQKSWDDFFAPTSSFNLNIFVADKHLDASKALFYQFLLETEPGVYMIDFRGPVLSHWLRVLLQAPYDDSCIGLTRSVFNQEKDSLAIPTLAALFHAPGKTIPVTTIRDNIAEIRHGTIQHVIAQLSGQENNAEAEWLPGGLDESDAALLLRTIFLTMKETWISLSEQPEEQDKFTLLVHAALDQYEVHSRSDFVVDPWFFNPAMVPQRRKRSFAKLFAHHDLSDLDFIQEAMETMQQETMHADRSGQFEELLDDLKTVLIPRMVESNAAVLGNDRNTELSRHVLFIRGALLPLAKEDGPRSDLSLELLVHIMSSFECRISTHDIATLNTWVDLFAVVIATLLNLLPTLDRDNKSKIYRLTLFAFELWMMAGFALSDDFMDNVGQVCESAMQDGSTEGLLLVEAVISRV